MKISIIIPAYQEEKRIQNTLKRYCEFFQDKTAFEIIVVLNACKDGTEEIIKKYMEIYPQLRYLNLPGKGKGLAIIEGFKEALSNGSDLLGFVDADCSTEPEAYYDLIVNVGDYDGIIASRRMKESKIEKTWKRTLISFTFNSIVRILFFLPFRDTQCLPSSSEVFTIIDGKPFKGTVEELEKKLSLELIENSKDFKMYSIKNNVKIPSLNKKNKRVELAPLTEFIVRRDRKELLEIKLEGGRVFSVSENHPLVLFDKTKFYEKNANKLKVGDTIPIVKKWNLDYSGGYLDLIDLIGQKDQQNVMVCGWKNELNIRPSKISKRLKIPFERTYSWFIKDRIPIKYYILLEKDISKRKNLHLCFSGGKHKIPVRIRINKGLLRLIGYYISEGCCVCTDVKNKGRYTIRISFNKNETNLIEETKELFSTLFNIEPKVNHQNNCTTIRVHSRVLCLLFKDILKTGENARKKRVPSFIYSLNKEEIGNFIDTYFLGDGNVSLHSQANSINIRANSASKELMEDLQLLLLRLGITSNVSPTKREEKIIGRTIKNHLENRWNINIHCGSNVQRFGEFCPIIKETHLSMFSNLRNRNPSIYERKSRIIENSDICFARIKKIEKKIYSGKWYDFKVQSDEKPYENFMHDCGIISHNCGAKIFKKAAIEGVINDLKEYGWIIDIDLLYRLKKGKFRIKEHPTVWEDRAGTTIKLFSTSFEMLMDLLRLRIRSMGRFS